MDKNTSHKVTRETFQNPFQKERFVYFIKNLLNHIEEKTFIYRGNYIPDAYKLYINTLERIGKYKDNKGNKIDILIVNLTKQTSLERARTMQRNFIAWYLNGSRGDEFKDGALVAFTSPNEEDWRFSLVKMEYRIDTTGKRIKTKQELTPAKRFSFLVGKNENSHTAQSRLVPILEDDIHDPNLKNLEDAFNIEKVTKEFFEKYRELFLWAKETLEEVVKKDSKVKEDFKAKNISVVDFSKKLLGQIVFLYFLQKKGWFGVPMGKNWGEGDKKFLRSLFIEADKKNRNYFNDYLEPLFYEALAKERDDDYYSRFNCRIPFLNGGLFDPINNYDWVNTVINLPNDLFSNTYKTKEGDIGKGVLDIFDRYNFTVKEDEPLEKEVAVDPEMLGKVFENLLEVKDRKSKGTYYTPREIVHYMCEQSLINYLTTETDVTKERIEKLVKQDILLTKDDFLKWQKEKKKPESKALALWEGEWEALDKALEKIRIADPACGSGAFLVGMLQEIVKARRLLQAFSKKTQGSYSLKEHSIRNSIYGVDIDPGAVEIAKLRLWLSLVVDEEDIKQIKPLPNLDYKIMQGNSLLEEFEGIKLFDEKLITTIDFDREKQIESLKQRQSELQKEYFELHLKNKLTPNKQAILNDELKRIGAQLKNLFSTEKSASENAGLFDAQNEAKQKADQLKKLHKEFFEATQKKKKDDLKKQIETLEWELIETTLKEQRKTSALKKLEEFKKSNTKPFFLWRLNFAEVFDEKGGFDVVIANPPYIVLSPAQLREYKLTEGNYNTYVAFLELALKILYPSGVISYIIPTTWLAGNNFKELRKFLLEKQSINQIVQLPYDIFEAAYVDSLILIINGDRKKNEIVETFKFNIKDIMTHGSVSLTDFNVKEWTQNSEYLIFLNENLARILIKYRCLKNKPLCDIAKVQRGTLPPKENQLNPKNDDDKLIPWFSGQVYRYLINPGKKYWVKYEALRENKPRYLFVCKKILGRQLISRQFRLQFTYLDEEFAFKKNLYAIYDLDENISPYYLLAILNSKFYSYVQVSLNSSGQRNDYPAFSLQDYKNFLISVITSNEQKPFIALVNKILAITKSVDYLNNSEKQAKVREYENQIDQLVYKLYGLTGKEIRIIEGQK